jgi:hypothetical protein
VPVDRGSLKTAPHPTGGSSPGWIDADGVYEYPLLSTGADDFGAIGGVGMRLYYWVLMRLTILFLILGVISIPALVTYHSQGKMFSHPSATRFSDSLGAKQSLGNLVATNAEIEAGTANELWLAAITNAVATMIIAAFALTADRNMHMIAEEVRPVIVISHRRSHRIACMFLYLFRGSIA